MQNTMVKGGGWVAGEKRSLGKKIKKRKEKRRKIESQKRGGNQNA